MINVSFTNSVITKSLTAPMLMVDATENIAFTYFKNERSYLFCNVGLNAPVEDGCVIDVFTIIDLF